MKKFVVPVVAMLALSSGVAGCKNRKQENCRQAYREMQQFLNAFRAALGGGGSTANTGPAESEYVNRCSQLSEPATRCMIMSYRNGHRQECEQYRNEARGLGR